MIQEIHAGQTPSPTIQEEVLETFYRDGLAVIPNALSADECAPLRDITDRLAVDSEAGAPDRMSRVQQVMVLRHVQALDKSFVNLTVREPFLSYAKAIVGEHPKLCGMNVIRNGTDEGISRWHIDDMLEVPLGPDQLRHDPTMRMPVVWFTIQVALTDILTYEQGPTEYVPGSHYSGRSATEDLTFDGRGPISVYCKAGDAYLFNHQVWHRGAPNASPNFRYLMQIQYCRRLVHDRFSDAKNTQPPPDLNIENAALRDVLGMPA